MRPNLILALLAGALFVDAVGGGNACLAGGEGFVVQAVGDRLAIGVGDDTVGGQQMGQRVLGDVLPLTPIDRNPSFFSLATPTVGYEALPVGDFVNWDFLPITINDATANLFHWDATGSVDFTPAVGDTLSLFDVTNTAPATIDGSAAAVPGENLSPVTNNGLRLHAHNLWALLGEGGDPLVGPGDDPTPGIYLAAMRLRLDGYVPTEPFFVALATFGTSISALENDAVPWIDSNVDDLILRGDYNFDGLVGSTDYELWRDQYGATSPQPVEVGEADGNRDGRIDAADYTIWRDALSVAPATAESLTAPEPGGAAFLVTAMCALATLSRREPSHESPLTAGRATQDDNA